MRRVLDASVTDDTVAGAAAYVIADFCAFACLLEASPCAYGSFLEAARVLFGLFQHCCALLQHQCCIAVQKPSQATVDVELLCDVSGDLGHDRTDAIFLHEPALLPPNFMMQPARLALLCL